MIRYKTEKFDIINDDILWEKFMCFARSVIPYDEHWNSLTEQQKYPLVMFIYDSEVLGEGHMGFLDLHSEYIDLDDVLKAMEVLHISQPYMENAGNIPLKRLSVDALAEQAADEDEFAEKMDELDEMFDIYDKAYYELSNGSTEIDNKILDYLRSRLDEFFELAE